MIPRLRSKAVIKKQSTYISFIMIKRTTDNAYPNPFKTKANQVLSPKPLTFLMNIQKVSKKKLKY